MKPRNIPVKKSESSGETFKRLMSYVLKEYKIHCFIVLIAILISSLAGVYGSLFLKTLIDDYIAPFLNEANPNFAPLLHALIKLGVIYYIGVIASYLYSKIMVIVSQGALKKIRDDMFEHMESLPIKYFDTNAHGDIMSLYTNDTDTLRQMLSQSIPQLLS